MEYFILLLAVLCIAVQFNINKLYQKQYIKGLGDILFFPFLCGTVNIVFFTLLGIALYGQLPSFSIFSMGMSVLLAIVSTLSALVGILVLKYGSLSVYSIFMMLGGMILPYFYGVLLLGEALSATRIAGFLILICALPLSVLKPKGDKGGVSSKYYYILCILIFCINGTISIISKTHSINTMAVPAANFIALTSVCQTIISGAVYGIYAKRHVIMKQTNDKPNKTRMVITVLFFIVISGIGYLLQLIAAKTVPAVVLFPFITGGGIVLSTLIARIFFKEKLAPLALCGIAIALVGTVVFLI